MMCALSSTVIMSAAPPGQTGHYHINLKPSSYWINKFKTAGFFYDEALSRQLMKEWEGATWWYTNNTIIFKRRTRPTTKPIEYRGRTFRIEIRENGRLRYVWEDANER
jgi:hypothetical protein